MINRKLKTHYTRLGVQKSLISCWKGKKIKEKNSYRLEKGREKGKRRSYYNTEYLVSHPRLGWKEFRDWTSGFMLGFQA